jgi:hypothetical protein
MGAPSRDGAGRTETAIGKIARAGGAARIAARHAKPGRQVCRDLREAIDAAGAGGGAEGNRTPDLLIANEALSHLSYSPAPFGKTRLIAPPPHHVKDLPAA